MRRGRIFCCTWVSSLSNIRPCVAQVSVERTLGGLDVFLPYIYDYVNTFTGKSITTEIWKDHLYVYFTDNGGSEKIAALDTVHWEVSLAVN